MTIARLKADLLFLLRMPEEAMMKTRIAETELPSMNANGKFKRES